MRKKTNYASVCVTVTFFLVQVKFFDNENLKVFIEYHKKKNGSLHILKYR